MTKHMSEDEGLFIIPDDGKQEGKRYPLPNNVYDVLKWVGLSAIPWISWGLGELLPDYGIDPYRAVHFLDTIGSIVGGLIVGSAVSVAVSARRR